MMVWKVYSLTNMAILGTASMLNFRAVHNKNSVEWNDHFIFKKKLKLLGLDWFSNIFPLLTNSLNSSGRNQALPRIWSVNRRHERQLLGPPTKKNWDVHAKWRLLWPRLRQSRFLIQKFWITSTFKEMWSGKPWHLTLRVIWSQTNLEPKEGFGPRRCFLKKKKRHFLKHGPHNPHSPSSSRSASDSKGSGYWFASEFLI